MSWNDPNSTLPPGAGAPLPPQARASKLVVDRSPVYGILGTVFGALSLVPFLGIFSPVALVFGIIGLVKKEGTFAIVGTCLATAGLATSPILWALAGCGLNPTACKEITQQIKDESAKEEDAQAQGDEGAGEMPAYDENAEPDDGDEALPPEASTGAS